MHNKAYALMTGAFLLVLTAGALAAASWLAGVDRERVAYVIVTDGSVTGLSEGAQVFYRGVRAGRVERIRLDPDSPEYINIEVALSADLPIRQSTYATLRQSPLTGITQVELDDSGEYLPPLTADADEPPRIGMRPGMLEEITEAGYEIIDSVTELLDKLNALLDDDNRDRLNELLTRLDSTLEATAGLVRTMDRELGESMVAVRRSLRTLDALGDGAAGTLDQIDTLLEELAPVIRAGGRLSEDMRAETVPSLNRALERLEYAGDELGRLARSLRQQPDSLLRGPARQVPGPGEE